MTFKCPEIDGMRRVPDHDLIFKDSVIDAPYLPQGREMRATDYYREIIGTIVKAGYEIKRGAATLTYFGRKWSEKYKIPWGSELKPPYRDSLLTTLVREDNYRQSTVPITSLSISFGPQPDVPPLTPKGDDNPLFRKLSTYMNHLYFDASYREDKVITEGGLILPIGSVPGDESQMVFYLADWLSGCAYASESFARPAGDKELMAAHVADIVHRMMSAAEQYTAKANFTELMSNLTREVGPWDLGKIQIYTPPQNSNIKSDWEYLFESFGYLFISAAPFGQRRDVLYDMNINGQRLRHFKKGFLPNRLKISEPLLKNMDHAPIPVNGSVPFLGFIARGLQHSCFTGDMDRLRRETNVKLQNTDMETYYYVDKFDNTINAMVHNPWWHPCFDGIIGSVLVMPAFYTEDNQDESLTSRLLSIDLSPLGLDVYNNLAQIRVFPPIHQYQNGRAIHSDYFGPKDLSPGLKANIAKGIETVEELFGQESVAKRVFLFSASAKAGGYIYFFQKDAMFLFGKKNFEKMGSELGWVIPFHEGVHLIDIHFGISDHPGFKEQYAKFQILTKLIPKGAGEKWRRYYKVIQEIDLHSFMLSIHESKWFKIRGNLGHPWDSEKEFMASLCTSLMHPNIKERFESLSPEDQGHYIESLKALAKAIEDSIPGKSLPITAKIRNTIATLKKGDVPPFLTP